MSNAAAIRVLNRLHRICTAGEYGFNTVSEGVSQPGLKVLIKTIAEQRRAMAAELVAEAARLGAPITVRRSVPGMIHRGRITIFSALTIGRENVENVVLTEALRGEQIALRAYRRARTTAGLPGETHALIERQFAQVQSTADQIGHLKGRPGERLVVHLFNAPQQAEQAVERLVARGFERASIEHVELAERVSVYNGKGATVAETIASGALGGGFWGAVFGIISGVLALIVPGLQPVMADTLVGMAVAMFIASVVLGALSGAVLGLFIGVSVAEEDSYLYDLSLAEGKSLVFLRTQRRRAREAFEILERNGSRRDAPADLQPRALPV